MFGIEVGTTAVVVKFALDLIIKKIPKRFRPFAAPILAIILNAIYQALLPGGMDFSEALNTGLVGGLGAIGLNETVSHTIKGN